MHAVDILGRNNRRSNNGHSVELRAYHSPQYMVHTLMTRRLRPTLPLPLPLQQPLQIPLQIPLPLPIPLQIPPPLLTPCMDLYGQANQPFGTFGCSKRQPHSESSNANQGLHNPQHTNVYS